MEWLSFETRNTFLTFQMKSVAGHCSKSWAIIIRPKMKSYGAKHTHGFVCFKNLPINNVRALKSASWTVITHALLFISWSN